MAILALLPLNRSLQAQSNSDVAADSRFVYPAAAIFTAPADHPDSPAIEHPVQILRIAPSTTFVDSCVATTSCADLFFSSARASHSSAQGLDLELHSYGLDDEDSKPASVVVVQNPSSPDFKQSVYHRNRLEFGFDVGWHPVNIPFVYDFAVGDSYHTTSLKYTLVPIIASVRWHVTDVGWPWILRGNFDFTFSGSVTAIPRGPETHYFSFMFGIRRNFVHRNWKIVPYFDQRGGIGLIDAKEPLGVLYAQGQNLTFTYAMGAGVRHDFNSKYSFSAGMNYMHVSNGYRSEPAFVNYGINVYGPLFGIDVRLGKGHRQSSE